MLLLVVLVRAAQQTINVGTSANDTTGDTLRVAFQKANSNFTELYASTFTNGSFAAGNGMVKVTTNLHFATNAAYTTGLFPYANATNGIGFTPTMNWDTANSRLTVGSATAGSTTFLVYGDGTSVGGISWAAPSGAELNRLWSDGGGNSVLLFGGSVGLNNSSFTLRGSVGGSSYDAIRIRNGNITEVNGSFRPILAGPGVLLRTDANTNLAAVTIGSGVAFDGTTLSATGSGTVTSVGLSVPSWLTVAGSPVTTSGTLAVTAASGQTANRFLASPDGSSGAVSLRAISTNDLPTLVKDLGAITATTGDIFYYDGTNLRRLPASTSGYVLTAQGASTAPAWAAAAGGTGITNIFETTVITSNYFTVGKGGTLIVTNALTPQQVGASKLVATDSSGVLTNADGVFTTQGSILYRNASAWVALTPGTAGQVLQTGGAGANPSWETASGGGGGASTWVPNTALSYIGGGTNVAIDGSGGTNFYLTVTKSTWMTTPSNIPASASTNTGFTVFFKMDSTGTWPVGWTNANFKFPGGPTAAFQPDTNANAVSWVSFVMSPFTNGIFMADYGVLGSQ